jgi:glutamyl-tRNA synthetase
VDLRITHIVRGQDHLSNTFKHVLIFEALGAPLPQVAHLPLLIAPDGAKLSKRKHGPVVSVTTYRDAGFLPHAYVNFLCLLGWSPKDDRERMTLEELVTAFRFEGVNRSNAVVNFTEEDPIDPKALWLNSQHIYALTHQQLTERLMPIIRSAGYEISEEKMLRITPLIQERIRTLNEVVAVADFFLNEELAPYDPSELIPQKGDAAMAERVLDHAQGVLASAEWTHPGLESALRHASAELGIKAGQMFVPIRVAVCGRKTAPPLFETLEVLGRETALQRIRAAQGLLKVTK